MIPEMIRGDLIQVDWVDIYEDVTGDPDEATLAKRSSFGLYWGSLQKHGVQGIVTTTTLDDDTEKQNGFCAYPLGCIVGITIIKKKRRPKKWAKIQTVGTNTSS